MIQGYRLQGRSFRKRMNPLWSPAKIKRKLPFGRLPAVLQAKRLNSLKELIHELIYVIWQAYGIALFGKRPRDRLPNPPRRISEKPKASDAFKFVYRAHESFVSLLDQIHKIHASPPISRRNCHDIAETVPYDFIVDHFCTPIDREPVNAFFYKMLRCVLYRIFHHRKNFVDHGPLQSVLLLLIVFRQSFERLNPYGQRRCQKLIVACLKCFKYLLLLFHCEYGYPADLPIVLCERGRCRLQDLIHPYITIILLI